jgi:hypothetical protein
MRYESMETNINSDNGKNKIPNGKKRDPCPAKEQRKKRKRSKYMTADKSDKEISL